MPELRPLTPDDAPAAAELADRVWRAYDAARGLPERPPRTERQTLRSRQRFAHSITCDPDGATGAWDATSLVGVALARRREGLWGLSILIVDPDHQGAGLGGRLLDAALATAQDAAAGIIVSSADARAIARYRLAGFRLHPCLRAEGRLDGGRLPAVDGARAGRPDDLEWIDRLGRHLRGAGYGPDLAALAGWADAFVVVERGAHRGWAFVGEGEVMQLGAGDTTTAAAVLHAALAASEPPDRGAVVPVRHLTASHDWAVEACLAAGLRLQPSGPVCLRGLAPPEAYLPNGIVF